MKSFLAFLQKEALEQLRSHRFLLMTLLFILFGIMSPALAKLTPWMFEQLGDELANQGITIVPVEVDAFTSWAQYYKNIMMPLIVIVVMFSGTLCNELQKGTLINMLTKGLARKHVILAKALCITILWTFCYWLCFGITYAYNAFFWENGIVPHLFISGALIWLLGLWLIASILFISALVPSGTHVLLSIVGMIVLCYVMQMFPAITQYSPMMLLSAGNLLTETMILPDFLSAVYVCCITIVLFLSSSIIMFNQKKL